MEDGQGGAEAIVLAHLHPVPPRYQDLHLPALRDEGPLDPGGSQDRPAPGRAGGGLGAEVGDEAGDGDVARQHGVKGWVPRDGDLQSLEVLWVGEERSCERHRQRVPPQTPTTGHPQGREMRPMVPSYLCHLRGQTPPGPPWGQTPRAAAAGGLRPSSALQRGRKIHPLCLQSKAASKKSFFCTRGEGRRGTLGGWGDGRGVGAQRERHRRGRGVTWTLGWWRGEGRQGSVSWLTGGRRQHKQPGPSAGRPWVPSSPTRQPGPLGTAKPSLAPTARKV